MQIKTVAVWVLASVVFGWLGSDANAYRLQQRWTTTATDGSGVGALGTPITLTWSIVPDGTSIPNRNPSNMIASFDQRFGAGPGGSDLTQRPWFTYFQQSFDRWGELGGITYVYEPFDDGVTQSGNFPGILGVRGDLRIAGTFIDGPGNVLAYNFFPNNGNMVLDTGDMNFYGNSQQNYRRLRNTIMHEHGHGMGLAHVESNNAAFLMEPFINTNFDGPQLDDILGLHRGYGDRFEKNGGNDTPATATPAGTLNPGDSFAVGTNGRFTFVNQLATDFVSIHGPGDIDFYSFVLPEPSIVSLSVEPIGPTYLEGPQGGGQSQFNASQLSDLTLALFDTDQTTMLAFADEGGLGFTETINDFLLPSGQYYARVRGKQNNVQLYEFRIEVEAAPNIVTGDFNGDGVWDCADINALTAVVVAGTNDPNFDLTGSGVVNYDDVTAWLAEAGEMNPNATGGSPFLVGDSNLDGVVDGADFIVWNQNKFSANSDWCAGDFNVDGVVDGADFIIWNQNKFMSSANSMVPEPASAAMLLVGLLLVVRRRRA